MRQPRRTRARRPDFGDLHAGYLLLGSNNELVAIGRLDKRFLPRAGRYKFESHRITCPWHGADFDLKTGAVLGPPAQKDVPSYKVVVEGDDIKVEV